METTLYILGYLAIAYGTARLLVWFWKIEDREMKVGALIVGLLWPLGIPLLIIMVLFDLLVKELEKIVDRIL